MYTKSQFCERQNFLRLIDFFFSLGHPIVFFFLTFHLISINFLNFLPVLVIFVHSFENLQVLEILDFVSQCSFF